MKKYIITYQFRSPWKDYMPFYETLKVNMPEYRHICESAWIVKTNLTAEQIRDILMPKMYLDEHSDTLFVAELGEDMEGLIARSHWDFIKDKNETV